MINQIIFSKTRRIPQSVRNILMLIYPFYLDIKHIIQYGKRDIFDTVTIETMSLCNRTCHYCPNSRYKRPDKKLDMEYIKKIFFELSNLSFKGTIIFTGYNEPLMDLRIETIIRYLRSHLPNNEVMIYTNGDFLNLDLFKKLSKLNIIFMITAHKKKMNANLENLGNIVNNISKEQKKQIYIRKNIENDILSSRCGLVKVKNPEKRPCCIIPYVEMTIDHNGNIILCCNDYFSSIKFGNIKKDRLIEVWNKGWYKRIRTNLRFGKFDLPICKKCVGINY